MTSQFSQEWARRKVVVKHSIKSNQTLRPMRLCTGEQILLTCDPSWLWCRCFPRLRRRELLFRWLWCSDWCMSQAGPKTPSFHFYGALLSLFSQSVETPQRKACVVIHTRCWCRSTFDIYVLGEPMVWHLCVWWYPFLLRWVFFRMSIYILYLTAEIPHLSWC